MGDNRNEMNGNGTIDNQNRISNVHVKGNKNNFNSNNRKIEFSKTEIHIKAERDAAGSDTGDPAILFGIFALTVFAAWAYVRHLDSIMEYLRIATLISVTPALPAVAVLVSNVRRNVVGGISVATTLFPLACAGALVMMLSYVSNQMPSEMLALASTRKPWEFWSVLSNYGHQVLLQNLGAVVTIAITALINFFMGLHTLADQSIYANGPSVFERLYAATINFRPARAGVFIVLLVVVANLLVNGEGVALFHQFQEMLKAAMS